MAYDEHLAERIESVLQRRGVSFEEKKMMGGLTFMVDGKMCIGIVKQLLMARIGPDVYEETLKRPGAQPMDFTGRPMKGYVFVEPDGVDMEKDLEHYVDLALQFNPKAKSSKKRKA